MNLYSQYLGLRQRTPEPFEEETQTEQEEREWQEELKWECKAEEQEYNEER